MYLMDKAFKVESAITEIRLILSVRLRLMREQRKAFMDDLRSKELEREVYDRESKSHVKETEREYMNFLKETVQRASDKYKISYDHLLKVGGWDWTIKRLENGQDDRDI